MKEQIVTGQKFRILANVAERLWHVISFWTKAQDVEFNDGTNAQSKLGNIAGISDSLTSTASNVAASAKAVKVLNDKVVNQIGNLNSQITDKNNTITDLNNQISSKNQTITNLNKQIEELRKASITSSNIASMWLPGHNINTQTNLKDGGYTALTYTATRNVESCKIYVNRNITNHDNSFEGGMAIRTYINGSMIAENGTGISEWSGGSCTTDRTLTLTKGQVLRISMDNEGWEHGDCFVNDTGTINIIGTPA